MRFPIKSMAYISLLRNIKSRIRGAQYEALKAVNKELIALYWDIGKMIAGRQKGDSWGKSIVERLASDLQAEFPGMQGFSIQNLWYMRQFYLSYHADLKLQPFGDWRRRIFRRYFILSSHIKASCRH